MKNVLQISILLILLTKEDVMFSQTDFWEQVSSPSTEAIRSLVISPNNTIFTATALPEHSIFRSTDNGGTWTLLSQEGSSLALNADGHIFAGNSDFLCPLEGCPGAGLFRSYDNGVTWSSIGLDIYFVHPIIVNANDYIFVGTYRCFENQHGFLVCESKGYQSTDNGANWTQTGVDSINAFALNSSGHIFAATDNGLDLSTNDGNTWTQVGLQDTEVVALAINDNGYIFAGTRGYGLFRSTNNGQSWLQTGLVDTSLSSLVINSLDHIFVGTGDNGIYRSMDNGVSWTSINEGLTNLDIRSLAINVAGFIFTGTSSGAIFKSIESTTLSIPSAPVLIAPLNGASNQPTTLTLVWRSSPFAQSYRLQVSTDSLFTMIIFDDSTLTDTTREISSLSTLTSYFWRVQAKNEFGTSIWSSLRKFTTTPQVTKQYAISRSWNLLSIPLTIDDRRKSILFPSATSNAFSFSVATGYQEQDTLEYRLGYWLKFGSDQNISLMGLLRYEDTIDVEAGWNLIGSISFPIAASTITSIPPSIVASNFFRYDFGYVATDTLKPAKGYWVKSSQNGKLILSSSGSTSHKNRITIVQTSDRPPAPPDQENIERKESSTQFFLSEPHPNPFNPDTRISFHIPSEGETKLIVYDLLGREVATLLNQRLTAGEYHLPFTLYMLPSGVYFYRLQHEGRSETKKLILMK